MRRALRYDGVLAAAVGGGPESPGVTPETIREIKEYVRENRDEDGAFDIVWEGQTRSEDPGGQPPSCVPSRRRAPPGGSNPPGCLPTSRTISPPHEQGPRASTNDPADVLTMDRGEVHGFP